MAYEWECGGCPLASVSVRGAWGGCDGGVRCCRCREFWVNICIIVSTSSQISQMRKDLDLKTMPSLGDFTKTLITSSDTAIALMQAAIKQVHAKQRIKRTYWRSRRWQRRVS